MFVNCVTMVRNANTWPIAIYLCELTSNCLWTYTFSCCLQAIPIHVVKMYRSSNSMQIWEINRLFLLRKELSGSPSKIMHGGTISVNLWVLKLDNIAHYFLQSFMFGFHSRKLPAVFDDMFPLITVREPLRSLPLRSPQDGGRRKWQAQPDASYGVLFADMLTVIVEA